MAPSPSTELDRIAAMMRYAPYAVILCDDTASVVYVNDVARELYAEIEATPDPLKWTASEGYEIIDAIGRRVPPQSMPLLRALRGEVVREEWFEVRSKSDGRVHRITVNAHPLTNGDKIIGAMSVHRRV